MSGYKNSEALAGFASVVDQDGLFVNLDDVIPWKLQHPQPYSPDVRRGLAAAAHHGPALVEVMTDADLV